MEIGAREFAELSQRLQSAVESVVDGQSGTVRLALTAFLAEGHILIEDVPGVGKTVLAKAIAQTVGGSVRRIQFTPDLIPSDVTGVSIYHQPTGEFRFAPGPVFANIVIGDEINRASAKTQSALLEAMEERAVTVDGHTHRLPAPFSVIATQNPIELDGTHPLPEAQRDRFMMRLSLGYPDEAAELLMVRDRDVVDPLDALDAVVDIDTAYALTSYARTVHVAPTVDQYALSLVRSTREHPQIRLGASPRSTLQLLRAAKVTAAMAGRDYVVPDDIARLAPFVLAHRLIPLTTPQGDSAAYLRHLVSSVVAATPIPRDASV